MDSTTEKELLMARDAEWAAAAFAGKNINLILSFWTDDAVVMPPGFPSITGKDALREYVESSFRIPGFYINWKSDDVKFSPDGKLAYMFSENEVAMNGEDGTPVTMQGRAVTIWRKEEDGEWRCAVDIWNSEK